MPIVTYNGNEYECATALKGADYIRLLDDTGCKIVSFEGVVDFSLFKISGGSWTNTTFDTVLNACAIPAILPDGSFCSTPHIVATMSDVYVETVSLGQSHIVNVNGAYVLSNTYDCHREPLNHLFNSITAGNHIIVPSMTIGHLRSAETINDHTISLETYERSTGYVKKHYLFSVVGKDVTNKTLTIKHYFDAAYPTPNAYSGYDFLLMKVDASID